MALVYYATPGDVQAAGYQPISVGGQTWYFDPSSGASLLADKSTQGGYTYGTPEQSLAAAYALSQQQQQQGGTQAGGGGAATPWGTGGGGGSSYLGASMANTGGAPVGFQLMNWPNNPNGPTYYNPNTQEVYAPALFGNPVSVYTWGQGPGNALIASYNQQFGLGKPGAQAPAAPTYFGPGATAQAPETSALGQMAQIDPATEALRQQLAASYATPLSQAQAPSAATIQNYLNQYQQLDPNTYAAMQALGPQYQSYLNTAVNQAALGSTLDPITQMQLQQQVRAAQGARGNVYGTPQLVEEAMTTGQAGLQLQQQRMQNLASALGGQQSYLQSGVTPGAVGLNLYQQNLANLRGAQQGAQSYLGSGQTPYQAGAGYLANAQNAANASAQGFSYGQAAGLAPSYSYLNPAYGQQTANTALGYYNQMSNLYATNLAYGQQSGGSPLMGAAGGALSGAAAGSTLGPYGALAGAAIGGIMGGLSQ